MLAGSRNRRQLLGHPGTYVGYLLWGQLSISVSISRQAAKTFAASGAAVPCCILFGLEV